MRARTIVWISLPFCVALLLCYGLILGNDFFHASIDQYWPKLSFIIITFVYSLVFLFLRVGKKKKAPWPNLCLSLALAFTLAADSMLINDAYPFIAIPLFMAAQLFHCLRLYLVTGRVKSYLILGLSTRLGLCLIVLIAYLFRRDNGLILLALAYAAMLVGNFADALVFTITRKKVGLLLLTLGFALFIGCDLFVGLRALSHDWATPLMWLFYAPSQALIALTAALLPRMDEDHEGELQLTEAHD